LQSLVCSGSTGIGEMLRLADIELYVLRLGALSDYHSRIDFFTGTDEQGSPILGVEQPVGHGFSGLKGNQRPLVPVLQISFIGTVAIKNSIHDAVSLGVGEKFPTVADEASGRNGEFQAGIAALPYAHPLKLSLAET